jgi:anti-sigma factor RsiW
MTPATRPTDDELGEYVDGGLSGRRRAEIEAWLIAHPHKAAEVERLRSLNEALQGLGEGILEEPVPDRLRKVLRRSEPEPDGDARYRPRGRVGGREDRGERRPEPGPTPAGDRRSRSWRRFIEAAAVVSAFALGGVIGWSLRPHLDRERSRVDAMLAGASRAYACYATGRDYPIEFPPDRAEIFEAVAVRLFGRAVAPPDLETVGYRYLGARLAPAADITTTLFLFEGDDGRRITIVFWPLRKALATGGGSLETEGVRTRFWLQGGFGFAVIGEQGNARLREISGAVETHYRGALSGSPG